MLTSDAARDARRRIEELAASARRRDRRRIERERRRPDAASGGDRAAPSRWAMPWRVETLDGRAGPVVELRDEEAVVAVGALKLTVPASHAPARSRASPEAVPARAMLVVRIDPRRRRRPPRSTCAACAWTRWSSRCSRALDAAVRADLQRAAHHPRQGHRRAARARGRAAARAIARVREHSGSARGTRAARA